MSLDYSSNHTGLADFNIEGSFVTHFIFRMFLLLFTIPIRVQAVHIYSRLWLYQQIRMSHIYFINVLHTFSRLYHLAWECQNLQEPTLETSPAFRQTLPPLDEYLFIQMDRPIIEYQQEESAPTTAQDQQNTLVPMQDWAPTEFKCQQKICETFAHQELTFLQPSQIYTSSAESQEESQPPEKNRDQQPANETPIHPVEPVLGTTPLEECWIQCRQQGQDIWDILETTAYEGYVRTPIQTLDSLYINQPKCFLPLTEEAKQLAKELHKEKEAEQWAGIPHENLLNQSFLEQLNSLQILE